MTAEIKKCYYESGEIFSETPYENGVKNGVKKWYYGNGEIMLEQ